MTSLSAGRNGARPIVTPRCGEIEARGSAVVRRQTALGQSAIATRTLTRAGLLSPPLVLPDGATTGFLKSGLTRVPSGTARLCPSTRPRFAEQV